MVLKGQRMPENDRTCRMGEERKCDGEAERTTARPVHNLIAAAVVVMAASILVSCVFSQHNQLGVLESQDQRSLPNLQNPYSAATDLGPDGWARGHVSRYHHGSWENPAPYRPRTSDTDNQQPYHAQVERKVPSAMVFSNRPVEPFTGRSGDARPQPVEPDPQRYAARVSALPWYTSASQQDEKWGGVHQSNAMPNIMQNAYLYAQHVAQSHTGQLLRWRNYVTQHRSDATPKEQLAQARGMAFVANTEYNQARAQLAAMKKLAVIRRLNTKRQQASQLTSDVNNFATSMLRNEDLAKVKQDEAYGKIASAAKILNRMAHVGLLRRNAANERLRHLQQLPYAMTTVVQNANPATPNARGYVSSGWASERYNTPAQAYGPPAVADCGPAGSSMAADTVCNGVPTAIAATMLGTRLQVDEANSNGISLNINRLQQMDKKLFVDEANINSISLNINRLQHMDNKLFEERAQREYDIQVNASRGLPIILSQVDKPY